MWQKAITVPTLGVLSLFIYLIRHFILFWLNFLQVNASGQLCRAAEMQITGSKIDGLGSNIDFGVLEEK